MIIKRDHGSGADGIAGSDRVRRGTTTIEVRPAKESGIRLQLKVTVK